MSLSPRRLLAIVGMAGIVALAVAVAASSMLQAAPRFNQPLPPPPTPLPTSLQGGSTRAASSTPNQASPAYFVTAPVLNGRILHWAQISYNYAPDARDPANGIPVDGDIWEQLGSSGGLERFRGHYVLEDGTFYQEILQTSDKMTVILGKRYPANSPAGCVLRGASAPPASPSGPPFVDASALARAGFKVGGGLTQKLPTTPLFPGVQPLLTYGPGSNVTGWHLTQVLQGGNSKEATYHAAANGRVLVSQGRITDKAGVLVSENRTSYGPLQIYESSSIPASVFAESQPAQEACRA